MSTSRRKFLAALAAQAGMNAVLAADILGVERTSVAPHAWRARESTSGVGASVLVIGAGISGLVAAYELQRRGFQVLVVEAQSRVGGRNLTLRDGDRLALQDRPTQQIHLSDDLYFNAGPARIPSRHQNILGYCSELGVPLEVFVNTSSTALCGFQDADDVRVLSLAQVKNDMRGYLAEILARGIDAGSSANGLNTREQADFVALMHRYGALAQNGNYVGSARSGYEALPGQLGAHGAFRKPVELRTLLKKGLWLPLVYDQLADYQAPLLQPVGGMDRLPLALATRLNAPVRLNTEVVGIEVKERFVNAQCSDLKTGSTTNLSADYVIITVPPVLLAEMTTNLPDSTIAKLREIEYTPARKIAWDAPRFWERGLNIYGGVSFIDNDIELIWYPSGSYLSPRGVLLAGYSAGDRALRAMERPPAEQLRESKRAIELLHPGFSQLLERPILVEWNRMPYSFGAWPRKDIEESVLMSLSEPIGRLYLAGDYLSNLPGWQEGAALSALGVVKRIVDRQASTTTETGPSSKPN